MESEQAWEEPCSGSVGSEQFWCWMEVINLVIIKDDREEMTGTSGWSVIGGKLGASLSRKGMTLKVNDTWIK